MNKQNNIIYGKHAVLAALEPEGFIKELFLSRQLKGDYLKEIRKKANQKKIKLNFIDLKEIQRKAPKDSVHQGIIAYVNSFNYTSLNNFLDNEKEQSFLVVLDQIMDPHNLGAIIRTAECAGVSAIMIPASNSADVNSTVIKTSTGAVFNLPIIKTNSLIEDLNMLKKNDYEVFSAAGEAKEMYSDLSYPDRVVLLIGNEEIGIRKQIRNQSDHLIKIPIHGRTESLNASVAAGILIYHISETLFS